MSIRINTPCDCDGICPYDAENWSNCEYWCGCDEPEDYPEDDEYDGFYEEDRAERIAQMEWENA